MDTTVPERLGSRLVLGVPDGTADTSGLADPDAADILDFGAADPTLEERFNRLTERFEQLEFVIVEQFEPGMTAEDGSDRGNLRDRLDRIEAALAAGPAQAPDAAPLAAVIDHLDAAIASLTERLDRIESGLADLPREAPSSHPEVLPLLQGISDRLARIETATTEGETLAAGIARTEAAVAALADRVSDGDRPQDADTATATALRTLEERIAALTETTSAPLPEPALADLAERLARAEARLSETQLARAEADRDDALSAFRATVAELLAENRRLSGA